MTISPQAYPLWLAEDDGAVGRVVGWRVRDTQDDYSIDPVVAWENEGGAINTISLMADYGNSVDDPWVFLADTREAALKAAAEYMAKLAQLDQSR